MTKEVKCVYCRGVHTHHIENNSFLCEYCHSFKELFRSKCKEN